MAFHSFNPLPNQWFDKNTQQYDNERLLYDMVLAEAYNQKGVTIDYFIVTYDTSNNRIFGEDDDRTFLRKFSIKGYFELPKEEQLWSKFGIESLDNFKIFISKKHFTAASCVGGYSEYTPKVGDVLKSYHNNVFYEIIDVGEEEEMFLQGKHSWEFIVRTFKDNHVALSADTSATMNSLSAYTNQDSDLFDVSTYVDQEVSSVLYTSGSTEDAPDSIWGTW